MRVYVHLAGKYLREAAPLIQPLGVEVPVSGEIAGVKVRGIGDPFCSGRFAGRDRAGHRWLDGGVGLTGAMQGRNGVASYRLARRSRRLKRGKREVTWTKRPTLIPEHRAACPR